MLTTGQRQTHVFESEPHTQDKEEEPGSGHFPGPGTAPRRHEPTTFSLLRRPSNTPVGPTRSLRAVGFCRTSSSHEGGVSELIRFLKNLVFQSRDEKKCEIWAIIRR